MDVSGATDKTCAELKNELEGAQRRYDELVANQPKVIEPLPLAEVPGGSLDQEAAYRAELERLLKGVESARQAFTRKCGPA